MQTEQAVTCKYPGCENEPRAADDGAGAKPKYCGRPDPTTGKPHTALTAFRRRQELTRPGGAAEAEDLGRPVTMATARAAELRNSIRADMATLTGKLTDLAAQLDRAADPEAAAAQVEAVQAEAAQQVADAQAETAREAQRRQQAEADAEEARSAAVEMDGKLQAAETARGQAEQRAADARADAEQARARPQPRSKRPRPLPTRRSAPHATGQPGRRLKRGRRSSALTPTQPPSSAPLRRHATTPPVNSRSCAPTLTGPARKPPASSARPAPMPNASATSCGRCWTPGPRHWQRPVTTCGPALSAPKPTWTRPAPSWRASPPTTRRRSRQPATPRRRRGGDGRRQRPRPNRTPPRPAQSRSKGRRAAARSTARSPPRTGSCTGCTGRCPRSRHGRRPTGAPGDNPTFPQGQSKTAAARTCRFKTA